MTKSTMSLMALAASSLVLGVTLVAQQVNNKSEPAAAASAVPADPGKVVITVGDMKLTAGDFYNFVSVLPPEVQATAKGPGKRGLAEEFVRLKLLANEARMQKLDETSRYQQQIAVMRDNLLVGLLMQQLSPQLVNDQEIQKFYDENKSKFDKLTAPHPHQHGQRR